MAEIYGYFLANEINATDRDVTDPTEQVQIMFPLKDKNMYGLLTECEVKVAGYWPSSFFFRVYGPRRSRGP